jgi:hypothetical protein
MKAMAFACLLVLIAVGVSEARPRRIAPIRVRMVAYIGEKVEGTRPDFTWLVSYRGERYQLFVLKLTVLGGGVTPLDINAAVAPYTVKFQVAGDKTALRNFVTAPPRQQVLISGHVRLDAAARFLMLDTVDTAYLPTPAPTRGPE